MSNYYIIDQQALTIISGPHNIMATEIKKLTNCGNPDLLGDEYLATLSIVPEVSPALDPETQTYDGVTVSATAVTKNVRALTAEELAAKSLTADKDAKANVDMAADAARARLISPGTYVCEEYALAHEDATAYAAAGYTGDVPGGVLTWAQAMGWTNEAAANDILYQKAAWKYASDQIRALRLQGKADVSNATTAAAKWTAGQSYIAQLNALFV